MRPRNDFQRNLLSNYINFAVMALVGLVTNPLLQRALGPELFGGWKAVQRMLEFGTVADGRATQALKWLVAQSESSSGTVQRRRDVSAAVRVWVRWLPAVLLVCTALVVVLPVTVKDFHDPAALRQCGAILALGVAIRGLLWIPDSVLVGVNQGYRSVRVNTCTLVLTSASLCVGALAYPHLATLAVITVFWMICNGAATYFVARKRISWWGRATPTRADVSRLARFSGLTLAWVGIERAIVTSELVLFAVVGGASAVSQLTFSSFVTQFYISICLISTSSAMPTLGKHLGAGEWDAASAVVRRVRRASLALGTASTCAVLSLNAVFVTLWVGPGSYVGVQLNIVIGLAALQFVMFRCDAQVLDASLRVREKVVVGAVCTLVGLVVAVAVGMYAHSVLLGYAILIASRVPMNIAYARLVQKRIAGTGITVLRYALAAVTVAACASWSAVAEGHEARYSAGIGLVFTLLAGGSAFVGLLDRDDRRNLARRLLNLRF